MQRYRAQPRMDSETIFVVDDHRHGDVIARCATAEHAEKVTAALNDHQGAVSPEITQAELDAAWDAWTEAWTEMSGRQAMFHALSAFVRLRRGQ